jgi:oligoendopeptidase F
MSKSKKTTNKIDQAPTWNLCDFYSAIEDQKITTEIKSIDLASKKFAKKYEGQIAKINSDELFTAVREYEKISEKIGKISSYSYLVYASDLSHQANLAFYQNTSEKLSEFESKLIFFTHEINEIDDKKITKLFKDSDLKKYQPFIRDCRTFKKYQLSQELEKFALEKNISGRNAFVRLFDETINNLKFPYNKEELTSQKIFDLLGNNDEKVRFTAAKSIAGTFEKNIK